MAQQLTVQGWVEQRRPARRKWLVKKKISSPAILHEDHKYVRITTHLHLPPRLRMSAAIPPLPLHAFKL